MLRQKDIDTLETMLEYEKHPDFDLSGMCATNVGQVSHLRRLERLGYVKCGGRCSLHPDYVDPYEHAEDSEYLYFEITDKGREEVGSNKAGHDT